MRTRIKEYIKTRRWLYCLFKPLQTVLNKSRRIIVKHRNATKLFRKYCLEISNSVENPTFVKVGANDGLSGDPCSDILLNHTNWQGVLVEPVPYLFEKLKVNFNDDERFTLVKAAIGPRSNNAVFFYVDSEAKNNMPALPYWYDQLGSFNRQHIVNQLGGVLEPFIKEAEIDVKPLSDLLAEHSVTSFELLHIDTEGYDYEVFKTLDFKINTPTLIFIEHAHLSIEDKHAMRISLRNYGYTVYDCGNDYFALNKTAYKNIRSRID